MELPDLSAFLISTTAVAFAEIGDKTQLLAMILATRFRRPAPLIAGIFVATVANHALAGLFGSGVGAWIGPEALRWVIGLGFMGMAAWTLIPDKAGDDAAPDRYGPFVTTLIAFFLAEMGDKTQLATVGLAAAHPGRMAQVILGTTAGMMLANAPVVLLVDRLAARTAAPPDLSKVRFVAAALFALFGLYALIAGVQAPTGLSGYSPVP